MGCYFKKICYIFGLIDLLTKGFKEQPALSRLGVLGVLIKQVCAPFRGKPQRIIWLKYHQALWNGLLEIHQFRRRSVKREVIDWLLTPQFFSNINAYKRFFLFKMCSFRASIFFLQLSFKLQEIMGFSKCLSTFSQLSSTNSDLTMEPACWNGSEGLSLKVLTQTLSDHLSAMS